MALEFVTGEGNDEREVHTSTEVPDDLFSGETLRAARDAFKNEKILHISLDAEGGVKVVTKRKGGK